MSEAAPPKPTKPEREDKLAQALRANLRRRKAQAKAVPSAREVTDER